MNTMTGDIHERPASAPPLSAETAAKIGFRELTDAETKLVQQCRANGESLKKLIEDLGAGGADPRNTAIARTAFEDGLMRAVRAVTKPSFF